MPKQKTLYKTPFSPAYWRDALADFHNLRVMVFAALMVAACVALSYVPSIPVGNYVEISWGFPARALCGLVCGPVTSVIFGVVEDTVSYMMKPSGGYFPGYALTTALGTLTYALFLYRAKVTVTRIFLAKLLTNIQNVFLGSLWKYMWSSRGYWVIVSTSAPKNLIMLPIQTVMLAVLFAALLPILHRMGFLPDQATEGLWFWKRWTERKAAKEPPEQPAAGKKTPRKDSWEE